MLGRLVAAALDRPVAAAPPIQDSASASPILEWIEEPVVTPAEAPAAPEVRRHPRR